MTTVDDDVFEATARTVTRSLMEHFGYTPEQIAVAEAGEHAPECEFDRDMGWLCVDQNEQSHHPAKDEMDEAAELVMFVLEHDAVKALIAGGAS